MAKEQTFKVGDLVKSTTKNDERILTVMDARYLVTPDGEGWEYTVEDSEGNTVRVREFGEDNLVLLHREPEAQPIQLSDPQKEKTLNRLGNANSKEKSFYGSKKKGSCSCKVKGENRQERREKG